MRTQKRVEGIFLQSFQDAVHQYCFDQAKDMKSTKFIGEAYLQGVMEGEVQELVRSRWCGIHWVRLC